MKEDKIKSPRWLALFLLTLIGLVLGPSWNGYAQDATKDTSRIDKDSLLHLVRIKDSLLLQASLDSMFQSSMIERLRKEKDSVLQQHRELIHQVKTDSADKARRDQLALEFNRDSRWNLRDSISLIHEDSVRRSVGQLLDLVFDDSARTVRPNELRSTMYKLMDHLANDSIKLHILNAKMDTTDIVIKKNRMDSVAFFLMNSAMDSAKVFMRTIDRNTIYMWVEDDLMLTQLLKKAANPSMVQPHWKELSTYKIKRKPVPQLPPQLWDLGSEFNLMVNQAAYSNWAKGGNTNIAFTMDVKTHANYTKGNISWTNMFRFVEGIQKQELEALRRSEDRLEFHTNFGHKAFKNYQYSLGADYISQIFRGYSYPNDSVPVSKFMAPGYITLTAGMLYQPEKTFKLNFSAASAKFTVVSDTVLINKKRYGLKDGQRVRPEFGAHFRGNYSTTLFDNVTMKTTLILFSNYLDHPEKVDVDWQLELGLKVNKYLITTIKTRLIYDDDVLLPLYEVQDGKKVKVGEGKRVQFMETLAISFKFFI